MELTLNQNQLLGLGITCDRLASHIGAPLFAGHVCDDNDEAWCSQLAQEGACDMYPVWMLLTCRKTCGNCGCEDSATNCSSLAKEEKCLHDDHVDWMLRNCRRSCKVCLGESTIMHCARE